MRVYLSVQNPIQINLEMVEEWGGLAGTRDQGALEAAAARPQTGYYSMRSKRLPLSAKAYFKIILLSMAINEPRLRLRLFSCG